MLGNETMVADITDDTTAVGKPTDLQTVADLQIGGRDVLDTKKLRLTLYSRLKSMTQIVPATPLSIKRQDIERAK